MTSKSKSGTRKSTPPPPHVDYVVEVNVDKNGNFTYTENGVDARTLRPSLGDTISWSVRVKGKRCPFQIEFPGFGPFGYMTRTIRSSSKPTKPLTVTVPKNYSGNLVMDYRVTVPGAWSDDPDVVPPSSDGVMTGKVTQNAITLDTDSLGNLTLTPDPASYAAGQVTWHWTGAPQDDFILTFKTPPAGWPQGPTSSVNGVIVLSLTNPSANQKYTIQTLHSNLSANGTLTITPS